MTSLSDFHTFARSNMMELEVILSEVYAARVSGETGFTMFDGGAHKGFHTKKMLDLPGCERVFAVEADPFMAETLQKNLADRIDRPLPQLHIIQKALQDNPSVTTIAWKSSPGHVGRSSIVSDNAKRSTIWRDNADIQYRDEMRIEATTIDLILAGETAPVPFLKLDLEGADLLALRGASRTLAVKRPIVAYENSIHAPEVHGFTVAEMSGFFAKLDYVPMDFVGEPMGPDNWFGFFEAWSAPKEKVDWLVKTIRVAIAKRPI